MNLFYLYEKARNREDLTVEEAESLYWRSPLPELMFIGNILRKDVIKDEIVTWQIDRNVNITNACVSGCKFCNFHCSPRQKDRIFITTLEEYERKITETMAIGGDQLLLQGGLHPDLGLEYYETLFRELKKRFPQIKLHALGPPEIYHIARISKIDYDSIFERLISAGLDSFPGAGAEILDNQVRKRISPGKCSADQWLEIMSIAHRFNLATSATMMYGHVETVRQRMEHLIKLRDLQTAKPEDNYGFLAFIPWIYRGTGTSLEKEGINTEFCAPEYLRMIAMSRIVLNNIRNIQASWLTVGCQTAQMALHGGANDFGSIMIEENVVSSAGADHRMDVGNIQKAIRDAGFNPRLRDQKYNFRLISPDLLYT